jgi:SUMO ligase MMS21 Smc5/6 complex component
VQIGHFEKVFLFFLMATKTKISTATKVVALLQNGHSSHFMHRTYLKIIKLLQNPNPNSQHNKNIGAYKNFLNFIKTIC